MIAANPRAEYYKVKGRLYEEIANEAEAMACFEKALELNPKMADVWSEMGRIYYNKAYEESLDINKIKDDNAYKKGIYYTFGMEDKLKSLEGK